MGTCVVYDVFGGRWMRHQDEEYVENLEDDFIVLLVGFEEFD